jgi:hypothetical protein
LEDLAAKKETSKGWKIQRKRRNIKEEVANDLHFSLNKNIANKKDQNDVLLHYWKRERDTYLQRETDRQTDRQTERERERERETEKQRKEKEIHTYRETETDRQRDSCKCYWDHLLLLWVTF